MRRLSYLALAFVAGVALCAAVFVYQPLLSRHQREVTIKFENARGIQPGSRLKSSAGAVLGVVQSVSDDEAGAAVRVELNPNTPSPGSESVFWLETLEFSVSGVKGLETLFEPRSIYCRIVPGTAKDGLKGLSSPPEKIPSGRRYVFRAERAAGMRTGSFVKHRDVVIGRIISQRLIAGAVEFEAMVSHDFVVTEKTTAWMEKPARAGFQEGRLTLEVSGAQDLLTAAVQINTLDPESQPAPEGTSFTLSLTAPVIAYPRPEDGRISFDCAAGITVQRGAPVTYRRLTQIGVVTDVELSPDGLSSRATATIFQKFRHLVRDNSQAWAVSTVNMRGGVFEGLSLAIDGSADITLGGIAIATPTEFAKQANDGRVFILLSEEPDTRKWAPKITRKD